MPVWLVITLNTSLKHMIKGALASQLQERKFEYELMSLGSGIYCRGKEDLYLQKPHIWKAPVCRMWWYLAEQTWQKWNKEHIN